MLTLNMDVPEPWLVEPVKANYDLDNLRLEVQPLTAPSPPTSSSRCAPAVRGSRRRPLALPSF